MHFEVVGVSGANQYTVNPLEVVTTWVPLIVAVARVLPPEAADAGDAVADEADEAGADGDELLAELPHADTASAAAASTAALHIFRISNISL